MSNDTTTTAAVEQHPDPCGMPQAPNPPCPNGITTTTTLVASDTGSPPTTTVDDLFCIDLTGARIDCDVITVAETVGGASGELPATGADTLLLGGAALAFVAVGAVLARTARREHRGLGR